MKNVIHWVGILIPVALVILFVVWLFTVAWEFFLGVALVVIFVLICNWYFGKKYGGYY